MDLFLKIKNANKPLKSFLIDRCKINRDKLKRMYKMVKALSSYKKHTTNQEEKWLNSAECVFESFVPFWLKSHRLN